MTERWLPVVGWDGYYEVSDLGNVRSVDRVITRSDGQERFWSGRQLQHGFNRHGYPMVHLSRHSSPITKKVHHLVLEAFVGPRPDGMEACHNNGDRSDPSLSNLRWDTPSANQRDSVIHGHHWAANKTHCPSGHPYDESNTKRIPSRPKARYCRACHKGERTA